MLSKMPSVTFQKSAQKYFGQIKKKKVVLLEPYVSLMVLHVLPYICVIINNPRLYSGKGRFPFLWYVQLKNLKLAKIASKWLEKRTDL